MAAGSYEAARGYARRALVLAPMCPNVIQHGGERIERQQIISGLKELMAQINAGLASAVTGGLQRTKTFHMEPSD